MSLVLLFSLMVSVHNIAGQIDDLPTDLQNLASARTLEDILTREVYKPCVTKHILM